MTPVYFAYTVACAFADVETRDAFVAWLVAEHMEDVCGAGAISADVVVLDGDAPRCEVLYRFSSREAFLRYEREGAPRLRAASVAEIARLKAGARVVFTRSTGECVHVVVATRPGSG